MNMVVNSPSATTSSRRCRRGLPCLFCFLFLFTFTFATSVSSSRTQLTYRDHCASEVPESTQTEPDHTTVSLLQILSGHYSGGERILGSKSGQPTNAYDNFFSFGTRSAYKTSTSGVYRIVADLSINPSFLVEESGYLQYFSYSSQSHGQRGPLRFLLNGFWSESSGKLCLLGSSSWHSAEGNSLKLDAVLKLRYVKNSTVFTSLVNGTLESLSSSHRDPNYFDSISLLAFPSMSYYNYSLVSEKLDGGFSGGTDIPPHSSLSLPPGSVCSNTLRRRNFFRLDNVSECRSSKNCNPLGKGVGDLPHSMSLYKIQCSENVQKLRYLIDIPNSSYFGYYQPSYDPNTMLVGEGAWDEKKNRLCIVACRIFNNSSGPFGTPHIGDCSIRLSFSYPAVWSIRNRESIVGHIWTNKSESDPGYFNRIRFSSNERYRMGVSGLRYEYTEADRVRKLCPPKKPVQSNGSRYPSGISDAMRLDMSVKDSKGKSFWGYAVPTSVGDQLYQEFSVESSEVDRDTSGPLNISYTITFTPLAVASSNFSSNHSDQVEIYAEGIYDDETGNLCMVGCKTRGSFIQESSDSMDCEILVRFQFPPLNAKKGGVIRGSIESTRKQGDPLFFGYFNLSATSFYTYEARRSIWRMDLEIVMALISNTLACVFVALQIFYVRRHPDALPRVSLVMLLILALGYMIPLVLNFEALFSDHHSPNNVLLESGGWLELNEVVVRVVTMVAFLLQFRLLLLAWSARLADGYQKGLWVAEKKAMFVTIPLYIAGGLIALFVNWMKSKRGDTRMISSGYISGEEHYLAGDLKSYAGLIVDSFLFPQIVLNIFQFSKETALSCPFYSGTTFVRLLPHAYDLYRAHNFISQQFNGSYMYANPTADFYSTAWDVIIPTVGVVFAVIIYLQQRFSGRCILPRRFRELQMYEKVPAVSSL